MRVSVRADLMLRIVFALYVCVVPASLRNGHQTFSQAEQGGRAESGLRGRPSLQPVSKPGAYGLLGTGRRGERGMEVGGEGDYIPIATLSPPE